MTIDFFGTYVIWKMRVIFVLCQTKHSPNKTKFISNTTCTNQHLNATISFPKIKRKKIMN